MVKKILWGLLGLSTVFASGAYWAYQEVESYVHSPLHIEENKLFTVAEGTNYYSLTQQLNREDILPESIWSKVAVRLYPEMTELKAGTFELQPNMSLLNLFQHLSTGKEHQFSITFVEGSIFREWRKILGQTAYLEHQIDGMSDEEVAKSLGLSHTNLDGLLMPETYHFVAGESDLSILKRASRHLQQTVKQVWENRNTTIPLKNDYELLILASIIEKETAVAKERDKVASVFVNRLNKKMRLQTDPTVIYGIGESFNGDITKKDLRTPTPYNTYVISGLPPTPIAMVGKSAIEAAAHPADTPYFYFVADGFGGHQFSKTLAEHNKAVQVYLRRLRSKN